MGERLRAVPNLVLVDVEKAVTPAFHAFAKQLLDANRLDRIVIDEAHLILTAVDYRENLGLLGVLRQIKCPLICLTATLPPSGELDLKQSLFMNTPYIYRISSDSPNLEYHVQTLSRPRSQGTQEPPSRHDLLLAAAKRIHSQDQISWSREGSRSPARSLYYVCDKVLGGELAKRLGCDFYHAKLEINERLSILTAWYRAEKSICLVATSALSAGLEYRCIRRITHLDAPTGMVDYGQETGRAGRDGLRAVCLVILPPTWTVNWERRFRSAFIDDDCDRMNEFLKTSRCLRQKLTYYLDGTLNGQNGVACSQAYHETPRAKCSNCAAIRHPESVPAPSSAGMQTPNTVADEETAAPVAARDVVSHLDSDSSEEEAPSSTGSSTESLSNEVTGLSIADCMRRQTNMQHAEAQALYVARLSTWGRACILCSLKARRQIPYPHQGCMQKQSAYAQPLKEFRRCIPFESGVGCFACGQSMAICQRKGKSGCRYPWFVWHCCWVAVHKDRQHIVDLLRALGCPELSSLDEPEQQASYRQ